MKDAQKPDHVSLNTLVTRLKEGRFVIPDFQREFEWLPWDIEELRNGIRHSRQVDEITSKEGEAALRWFEKVLA